MPLLLAIGGHTGTGKSTLAHALRRECPVLRGAFVIDIDQARREMLGYDLKTVMKPEDYADEVTERARAQMDDKIAAALKEGRSVIDASGFFAENGREHIEKLASDYGADFVGLWLVVPLEAMKSRIEKRLAGRQKGVGLSLEEGHASDACLGVIDKFGDIGQPQSKAWTILDASGSAEEVLKKAKDLLKNTDLRKEKPNGPPAFAGVTDFLLKLNKKLVMPAKAGIPFLFSSLNAECRMPNAPFHTDIRLGDWIDRLLPAPVRPYARLMRLDRPIGTWLLLWPCLWSAALAADGVWPNLWHMALFALGALVMRGAGCVVNDLYDRDIDPKVERTALRPLASGAVKPWQAGAFLLLLLLVGLAILLQFNALTIWIGAASLLLVFTYPLAKRFTYWPQLILGLTFNWGALLGWTSARGELAFAPLLLYAAGIFWTLGYDTIYAHQDKRDDALIGIKSLALYLGDRSRLWITGFYTAFLILLAAAGAAAGQGVVFYAALALPAAHAFWQLKTWRMDDPANCLARFRSNRDFGFLVFIAMGIGKIL